MRLYNVGDDVIFMFPGNVNNGSNVKAEESGMNP